MHVIVDLCVVPLGIGTSVSEEVAECQRILKAHGLSHQMHGFGTNIEGEWDTVFKAVRICHERIHEMGAQRISTTIKLGTQVDRHQTLADKVASVREKLE